MVEEIQISKEEDKVETKKATVVKADLYASVYAFNSKTPTGDIVGLLEISSKTKNYTLEGSNFNWDAFTEIFNEKATSEVIIDLIENPAVLRIPVGEQIEGQKNYYLVQNVRPYDTEYKNIIRIFKSREETEKKGE